MQSTLQLDINMILKKIIELLLTGRRTKSVEYMIYDTLLKDMVIPFTALL